MKFWIIIIISDRMRASSPVHVYKHPHVPADARGLDLRNADGFDAKIICGGEVIYVHRNRRICV